MANQLKVSLENIIPLTEARDHFSQIVAEVQKDKLYVLTKGGKPAVAIIDVKYLETISGGAVKTDHIESEIQKDPAKVGRVPMLKHDSKPLVFPENHNNATSASTPVAPKPQDHPVKINFQPADAKPQNPISAPTAPTFPPTAATPPATANPTTSQTPTPTPISAPVSSPAFSPTPISATPSTPTPPSTFNTPNASGQPANIPVNVNSAAPTPLQTPPVNPPQTLTMPESGASIDMLSTSADPQDSPVPSDSRTSTDDKPGPAQYDGDHDDLPDMEI